MTAEIAILNKQAVALAADSAVSTSNKIFRSANKIFRCQRSLLSQLWYILMQIFVEYRGKQ